MGIMLVDFGQSEEMLHPAGLVAPFIRNMFTNWKILRWSNALHSLPLVTGQWHTQLMSPHLLTGLTGNNNSLWAKNETVTQNLSSNVPSNELGKTVIGSFVCLSKGNLVNLAATTVMIYTRWNCPHNYLTVILNSCFALFRRQSSRFTWK